MKKTVLIIMIITLLSKVLGFARDITLSYYYGTSNISDAYLIAYTIPMVIFALVETGIKTGYIPIYSKIQINNGDKEGIRFTNNLINILVVICTFIIILCFIFTPEIVKIFASGFQGETLLLAIKYTRISLFGIYFTGLVYILSGYLQIKGKYVLTALVGIPMNIIIVMSIISSSILNNLFLPIGIVIAAVAQLLLLLPYVYKEGYRYSYSLDLKDPYIKSMLVMVIPIILGVSVNQINTLIDRTIASRIVIGGVSALNYADRVNLLVQGVFVIPITTVLFPLITKMATENNTLGFKKSLGNAITGINILVIPATIGSMIFAEPIIKQLFGRGAFDEQAVSLTSVAMFFYSIGMVGYALREVLSRAFYSMQDTKTPMKNAAFGMVLNIILNILLSPYLGISGLALATSISGIVTMILLFISLRKKIGSFGIKQLSTSFIKIFLSSLVMGLIAKISFNFLTFTLSQNISLLIAILIGTVSYFVVLYFMKIEDFGMIVNAIKRKFGKESAGVKY